MTWLGMGKVSAAAGDRKGLVAEAGDLGAKTFVGLLVGRVTNGVAIRIVGRDDEEG